MVAYRPAGEMEGADPLADGDIHLPIEQYPPRLQFSQHAESPGKTAAINQVDDQLAGSDGLADPKIIKQNPFDDPLAIY